MTVTVEAGSRVFVHSAASQYHGNDGVVDSEAVLARSESAVVGQTSTCQARVPSCVVVFVARVKESVSCRPKSQKIVVSTESASGVHGISVLVELTGAEYAIEYVWRSRSLRC